MSYDLHRLGWKAFQQLCLSIVREVLGQTVESFLDSHDGGRDGAFAGTWHAVGLEELCGTFVIQCKFTSRPNGSLRPSDLTQELVNVARLAKQGLCDSYVLMTNSGMSGVHAESITALLTRAGAKHVALLGSTWINDQITESKRLRMLVPRVYGLGDLGQILDERAYSQARAVLNSLKEDLSKVVVTNAYYQAAAALDRHGFVLLLGEPAAGKTTIASMLAVAAVDRWEASILKLDDPRKVVEHWNPAEPSQFFWLDDAFGVVQYEMFLVYRWNHILAHVKSMLNQGAKIVMTSRGYIYNRARRELKESAFPLLQESTVVIDVHDLSGEEKRQILYNHLKLGKQPRGFLTRIKPCLEQIAASERFIPEIARRLADPLFTRDLPLDKYHLAQFVDKREEFLQGVIQNLDRDSKAALALVYMRNGRLESPITIRESEQTALDRLGGDLAGCLIALEALNGSLVVHLHNDDESAWVFKHPTISDTYAGILADSPDLLGIFLQGSAPDKLIAQVTCGDVGIERSVIIPRILFPDMLAKLDELTNTTRNGRQASRWEDESRKQRFLTYRCSPEFLSMYLQQHPELLDAVTEPGLYLSAVSEVKLAVRLYQCGLLPQRNRTMFVSVVSTYAIDGDDLYALDNEGVRSLFTTNEFEELLSNVRTALLPNLGRKRRDMESDNYGSTPSEEHMEPFFTSLEILRGHFGDEPEARSIIERETAAANEWVAANTGSSSPRPVTTSELVAPVAPPLGTRSIFDDVDS